MTEQEYDALLYIETVGDQKWFNPSSHYHRYEPTPYAALEELASQYELKSSDRFVDFGCGKGRVSFYMNHFQQATVSGVEMNEEFYQEALNNKERYKEKHHKGRDDIHFHLGLAQEYPVHPEDNRFYFFNPFSMPIFMKVIHNIVLSVEASSREVELILYYASEEYTYFLEYQTAFELKEEIRLKDLYEKNPYEKFLIYKLNT
ncbi:class I SAM-dependent methyltransferase [Fictibacillus sp. KIGAM418]|uniref:Class I SAM-dependent methyltransferase n=1 Tax=Fictibacillus marinisediminis TaxID=2878389 RepID=A0A9X1XCV1_9BACL|nr:methyltransferase domain-containing protein [Fictibacillus marinisediminis]MCK6255539.1 class I SAM-dependent methyltransferase [Fictibacillus marinisediminis]